MCSPKVEQAVRERIAKEGRPHLSRRGFLSLGSAAAAGLAVASLALPAQKAHAYNLEEVIDLTHVFGPGVPTYTPGEAPAREDSVTVEANGFYIQKWTLFEHAGTHCDFPAHFIAGGTTVDNYDASKLLCRAVVIDISAKAAEDADAMVTVEDVEAWEAANGQIPDCALVFMYSGWESKWDDAEAFRNADADGVMHFPGFSGEAAAWLIEERNIFGIGVDTLSLDPGNSATFDVHYSVLGAERFGIENVANLQALMGKDAKVIVGVPRWEEGSGGPCRLLALA